MHTTGPTTPGTSPISLGEYEKYKVPHKRLYLEPLLDELDGLRDGGGVAAPVALGLGEDRPPLPRDRVHREPVRGHRRLRHRSRGREPPRRRVSRGPWSGRRREATAAESQEGGQGGAMIEVVVVVVVGRAQGPGGAEVGEEARGG